jgi:Ca-activated chloride channel homolog
VPRPVGSPVGFRGTDNNRPLAFAPGGGAGGIPGPQVVEKLARQLDRDAKDLPALRARLENERMDRLIRDGAKKGGEATASAAKQAREQKESLSEARRMFAAGQLQRVQEGQLGVNFAVQNNALRTQTQLATAAARTVQQRNVLNVGGIWMDDGYDPKMETVAIKAMSAAYFRILERHPEVRDVYRLGNYVVWVTPSRQALIIDENAGREELPDADIDRLFGAAK